jgi:adenylate cyclase
MSAAAGLSVTAIISLGLAVSFLVTDGRSATSRWLALSLGFAGLAMMINARTIAGIGVGVMPAWGSLAGVLEAATFIAGIEWGLRVGRTVVRRGAVRPDLRPLRVAQGFSVLYAVFALLFHEQRVTYLFGALGTGGYMHAWFWLFVLPTLLAGALVFRSGVALLRRRPDSAEAGRILAMLVVMPILGFAFIMPVAWAPMVIAVAQVVFLFGAVRYFMIQGARGQFMARFMAPQVAEMVRDRGLKSAMERRRVQVSVVCVDIRGFTAYAEAQPPETVMRLLRDFYAAVGTAAGRYGGTIKDLAGDGALIIIGAPVELPDHAALSLQMARRLQSHARPVVRRYGRALGLGVGVATGEVAVGIVGQRARFEYVAVGPAVNLASRLCSRARDGEIQVDAVTLALAGETPPGKPQKRYVKGLREPVATYRLSPEPSSNR